MPKPAIVHDLTGQRFGNWTAMLYAGWGYWECRCDCGRYRSISGFYLRKGSFKSCVCLSRVLTLSCKPSNELTKAQKRIYLTWRNMMQRCHNPANRWYKNHGARGIKVCERWHRFENFLADMGYRPEDMTIERCDNDGPYSPENCIWATRAVQSRNKRNNVWLTYNGETLCLTDWTKRCGFSFSTINGRLSRGWSVEEALTGRRP